MSTLKEKARQVLKWSEQYTKTDMVYLAKGGFWLNLATVTNAIILLVQLYAFGNLISPEVYGQYRYFFSIYGILAIASLSGFNSAVTRSIAQGNDGDLMQGFRIQTLGSLVGSCVALCVAGYYFSQGNFELATGIVILSLAMPLMESLDLYAAMLNGKKLFRESAIYSITNQTGVTLLLIIAMFFHASALVLVVTYFFSWIILKAMTFRNISSQYVNNNLLKADMLSIGFNFSAVSILNNIANYLDRISLYHYMGARELALYSIAIAPTEQMKGLFKNANALIFPKFSQRSEDELRATIVRKTIMFGLASFFLAMVYIALAPFLISVFFPQYVEIIPHSQIFALSLVAVMVIPLTVAMNTIPKVRAMYLTNTINPIITIILIAILIPQYGLWGAIAARSIGRFLNIFTTYLFFLFA